MELIISLYQEKADNIPRYAACFAASHMRRYLQPFQAQSLRASEARALCSWYIQGQTSLPGTSLPVQSHQYV